jgi:hypothetical protein
MDFEKITIRKEISSRGGGIEIDLTSLGFEGEKMTAYQNYLGGGMLGKVSSQNTIQHLKKVSFLEESEASKLNEIAEELKKYFHSLSNPDSEWESSSYDENQNRSVSGY